MDFGVNYNKFPFLDKLLRANYFGQIILNKLLWANYTEQNTLNLKYVDGENFLFVKYTLILSFLWTCTKCSGRACILNPTYVSKIISHV